MSTSKIFSDFLSNLAIDQDSIAQISLRYEEITASLNKKFRATESKKANSLQVGSYRSTKSAAEDTMLSNYKQELNDIESQFYENSISKQILFSDWYAHYKFFWQVQIDWIDEQKNFNFLRDKIPLTFSLTVIFAAAALIFWGSSLLNLVCRLTP